MEILQIQKHKKVMFVESSCEISVRMTIYNNGEVYMRMTIYSNSKVNVITLKRVVYYAMFLLHDSGSVIFLMSDKV